MSARVAAVLPAAGAGRRLGGTRKPYLELMGRPLLAHALAPFLKRADVEWVVVALPAEDAVSPPPWIAALDPRVRLVAGGEERGDSVWAALGALPAAAEVVVVHDAARPLLPEDVLERTIAAARAGDGAIAALPAADTVKEVEGGRVVATPERGRLWLAQTPQAFPREVLLEAYRRARREGIRATDDASLVERLGHPVVVVEGSAENLKVTRPADVRMAESLLASRGWTG